MWNSQVELENEMSMGGKERAQRMMSRNEQSGRSAHNPYAKTVFGRFVLPLAESIRDDMAEGGAGKRKSHVQLLRCIEPETVAYIAVRTVMTMLLENQEFGNFRTVSYAVGKSIQSEVILRQYEEMDQEAFNSLQAELTRRHSQDVRHRMTLATRGMRMVGIEPIDWGHGSRDQVGAYLMDKLVSMDFVTVEKSKVNSGNKLRNAWSVSLSDSLLELLQDVRNVVEETMPYFLPCIEQPKDWTAIHDGGYHTPAMRKMANSAIIGGNAGGGDLTEILYAMNTLQHVRWSVNSKVLDTAKAISKVLETEEIVTTTVTTKPMKPEFLEVTKKEDFTEDQEKEFKAWKKLTAEWHTQQKLKAQKYGRMFNVFRVGDQFRDERELFFVYHADFRGRFYPYTTGLNPQGSDLQRACLQFAEGKPLRDEESIRWFLIHGANKYGVDKVSFDDRVKWVRENHDLFITIAADPVENTHLWADKGTAGDPFQFLAWCFEYAEWSRYQRAFVSRLPIAMDGSCNGLQNFSAALRDELGGQATNLVPSDTPQDIYNRVAQVTTQRLAEMEEDADGFRSRWLKHGISRGLVKRSVMTLPYGSTRFSCRDFILQDYIKKEQPEEFTKEEWKKAAGFISKVVWASIGDVVVKAREAMDWLQGCSGKILEDYKDIRWTVPTGFTVVQRYQAMEDSGRIKVNIFGGSSWFRMSSSTEGPDRRRHRNGIAPNFIHSMDACHMQRVAIRCRKEGISALAMIHDDFGTLAADAAKFATIIREEFVRIYSTDDWLAKFAQGYIDSGTMLECPPSHGSLNLSQVIDSKYFFA